MTIHHSKADRRGHREDIPMVPVRGDDGVTRKASQLTCSRCGDKQTRLRTNGLADDGFRKIGWLVGTNASHDVCPSCLAKGKVIKMADHAKPERTMQPVDRRLLSRVIEEHWDDPNGGYQMGWSDAKIAEVNGVPIDWVKEVREADFGGTGDDPTLNTFIANQIEIVRDLRAMADLSGDIDKRLREVTATHNTLVDKANGLRNTLKRTCERVEALEKIAALLQPGAKRA